MTNNELTNCPVASFERFVTDGMYGAMKLKESFLAQSKEYLKGVLSHSSKKRHEYRDVNMVAKFVAKEIRKVDYEGLISDIFNYIKPEMTLPSLNLDKDKIKKFSMEETTAPYLLPQEFYIRPYLNKAGKSFLKKQDYLFGGQTISELLAEIYFETQSLKEINQHYDEIKTKLTHHEAFVEGKKIVTSVGSLSKIANAPQWNMKQVLDQLGEEFIIDFGKVDLSTLDEWILLDVLPKSILLKNRYVEDIRLDFIVMALDDEERIINMHNRRKTNLSLSNSRTRVLG